MLGNRVKLWVPVIIISLIISITVASTVSAQGKYSIPAWVKGIAGFWAEDKITDDEFGEGLSFLIDQGIIKVPKIQSLENEIKRLESDNRILKGGAEFLGKLSEFENKQELTDGYVPPGRFYRDDLYDFSLKLPIDWKIDKSNSFSTPESTPLLTVFTTSLDGYPPHVAIYYNDRTDILQTIALLGSEMVVQTLISEMISTIPNFKLLSSETFDHDDGGLTIFLEYAYTAERDGRHYTAHEFSRMYLHGYGGGYTFTYSAKSSDYDEYYSGFEGVSLGFNDHKLNRYKAKN